MSDDDDATEEGWDYSLGLIVAVVLMLSFLVGSLFWTPDLPEAESRMKLIPVPGITAPTEEGQPSE